MRALTVFLLIALMVGCSEPGPKYLVEITKSTPIAGSTYCSYDIIPVDGSITLPKNSIVATCGKYTVFERITIEINDLN
jgi:hypothetical protein